jgi:gliding motility-associated-like protein
VRHLKNIILYPVLFITATDVMAQECLKDSNFYSITYKGLDKNHITSAAAGSSNEVVGLFRHSVFSDFVTKFTGQGQVIWSNGYLPDYPVTYWWQYPWYERTLMEGMTMGRDSTCYIYGSTIEHGTTLNNAGPPDHLAGLILHLDRFGNPISGKYLGNWHTDYSVNSLVELSNGNLVVYLRSFFFPYTSKLLCIDTAGNLLWGSPLQTTNLYEEVSTVNPVVRELSNGRIMVGNVSKRDLADTLIYPFLDPIILPAPLYYFHFFSIDGRNGQLLQEFSAQCPPLTNTNAPADFVPQLKNITELPNGYLSFLGDMYIPTDPVIFYQQRVFSRRVVNLIVNMDGGYIRTTAYRSLNGPITFQNAQGAGNSGEQTALAVDSASQQPVLFQIGQDNQVQWSKAYANALGSTRLMGVALEKQGQKGYFIFQSDPDLVRFHLSVTDATGAIPCLPSPGLNIIAEDFPWSWFVNKVQFNRISLDVDFRISPFRFVTKPHPLAQQTDCQSQNACCTDFIDSLHPVAVSLCENETFTLPDHTLVKAPGSYYTTLKTQRGCDSILYYNVKVLKSPSLLTTSPDTCLSGASVIQLRALEGYDTYWWNNIPTNTPFSEVHAPGSYTVRVENKCGFRTDTIMVYASCENPIYFPNAFTPNGDLLNDILRVPDLNKNKLRRLTIFNRWGQLVFSTTTPNNGWDGTMGGKPQPAGVYVYFLEMEGLSGQKIEQRGSIVLIR